MNEFSGWWQPIRANYLTWLKTKLAQRNAASAAPAGGDMFARTYARLLKSKDIASVLEAADIILDCQYALDYDIQQIETLDDGTVVAWSAGEICWFITWFSISIRSCHRLFGDDFVRYIRKFNLADCYRPQRDDETQSEYDDAWLAAWVRFIELADAYGEPLAAQRVIQRLERLVSA